MISKIAETSSSIILSMQNVIETKRQVMLKKYEFGYWDKSGQKAVLAFLVPYTCIVRYKVNKISMTLPGKKLSLTLMEWIKPVVMDISILQAFWGFFSLPGIRRKEQNAWFLNQIRLYIRNLSTTQPIVLWINPSIKQKD